MYMWPSAQSYTKRGMGWPPRKVSSLMVGGNFRCVDVSGIYDCSWGVTCATLQLAVYSSSPAMTFWHLEISENNIVTVGFSNQCGCCEGRWEEQRIVIIATLIVWSRPSSADWWWGMVGSTKTLFLYCWGNNHIDKIAFCSLAAWWHQRLSISPHFQSILGPTTNLGTTYIYSL